MSTEPAKEPTRDHGKTPAPAVLVKKAKPSDDEGDDAGATMLPPPKQKMLPTGLSRAIVLATLLGALIMGAVSLFAGRFELVAVPNSPNGAMYRLDRLTGEIQYCGTTACTEVAPRAK